MIADPAGPSAMLDALAGEDRMAVRHPMPGAETLFRAAWEIADIEAVHRDGAATPAALERKETLLEDLSALEARQMARTLARGLDCEDGLRERLVWFWADHFTVESTRPDTLGGVSLFVEEAIRPHVAGRFADMLKAAVLHPMMQLYLDQAGSLADYAPGAAGASAPAMNENLAREVLELHTLGVGGAYGQSDVRRLAEMFSGLPRVARGGSAVTAPVRRDAPGRAEVMAALDDLAAHPDTARHIAGKLAVHFVSEAPDAGLVEALAQRFRDSGGDLLAMTEVLLTHPAAQSGTPGKVKPPFDFVVSCLRALGTPGADVVALEPADVRARFLGPLAQMGQPWQAPGGPDGWPEAGGAWITPQGLAARVAWTVRLPEIVGAELPDPRRLVRTALGRRASERLMFAARAAETRSDGVAVVLASPDFQRR